MTMNQPLRSLAQLKRDRYEKMHGVLTAEEAMQLAIESEEHAKAVGVFDPHVTHFYQKMEDYTNHADAIEKTEIEKDSRKDYSQTRSSNP